MQLVKLFLPLKEVIITFSINFLTSNLARPSNIVSSNVSKLYSFSFPKGEKKKGSETFEEETMFEGFARKRVDNNQCCLSTLPREGTPPQVAIATLIVILIRDTPPIVVLM